MISELVLEDFLVENLNIIEPGLTLCKRQFAINNVGKIDLLCEDKAKNLLLIELKTYANKASVPQIITYRDHLIQIFPNRKMKSYLICLSKNKEITPICNQKDIKIIELNNKRIPTKCSQFSRLPWKERQIIYFFLERTSQTVIHPLYLTSELGISKKELFDYIEDINHKTGLNIICINNRLILKL